MPQDPSAIEVEVVEIDGRIPPPPVPDPERGPAPGQWQDWRQWQGRVRTLDARWWPLWLLLGIVAVVLVLTIGLALGAVWLVAKTVRGLLHALFSIFQPQASRGTWLR